MVVFQLRVHCCLVGLFFELLRSLAQCFGEEAQHPVGGTCDVVDVFAPRELVVDGET